jgi:hypothetical protein
MRPFIKHFLLLSFFLLGTCSVQGYTLYLKLFTKDCSNCYAGLYLLNTHMADLPYQIVLKHSDKINENKIMGLFELHKFKQATLIYNDSLYDELEKDISTELIVKNKKNQTIYRDNIKQVNLNLFQWILSMNDVGNSTLEYKLKDTSIKTSIASVHYNKNNLYLKNDFDDWYFWDSKNNKLDTLFLDSNTINRAYGIEEKYTKRSILPAIQYFKTTMFRRYFEPSYPNVFFKNDSIVYVSFSLKTFDADQGDTSIYGVPYVFKMNFKRKQVLSIYKVPLQVDSNSYTNNDNFFVYQDTFYFNISYKKDFYLNPTTQKHVYATFVEKKNDSQLHFVRYENMNMPESYVKNKLYLMFANPTCAKDLVTMPFFAGVYDVKTKQTIHAPIPDSIFNDLAKIPGTEDYLILKKLSLGFVGEAYKFNQDRYGIIYSYAGRYHFILFNQAGDLISHKVLPIMPNTNLRYIDQGQYCVFSDSNHRILFHYLFD